MKKQELKRLVNAIKQSMEAKRIADELLARHASEVIIEATATISLRELARRTGLSITYLSLAKNSKAALSPNALLKISEVCK